MKDNEILQAAGSVCASRAGPTKLRHRILVVDDDSLIRQLNAEALTSLGYHVDAAEDGAAAWDTLQHKSYDLMVTDNEMPKVSGFELLKKVHAAHLALPVIMATGKLPKEEFIRCPWLKPAAALVKPYTLDELLASVRAVLYAAEAAPRQLELLPQPRSQFSVAGLNLR